MPVVLPLRHLPRTCLYGAFFVLRYRRFNYFG